MIGGGLAGTRPLVLQPPLQLHLDAVAARHLSVSVHGGQAWRGASRRGWYKIGSVGAVMCNASLQRCSMAPRNDRGGRCWSCDKSLAEGDTGCRIRSAMPLNLLLPPPPTVVSSRGVHRNPKGRASPCIPSPPAPPLKVPARMRVLQTRPQHEAEEPWQRRVGLGSA